MTSLKVNHDDEDVSQGWRPQSQKQLKWMDERKTMNIYRLGTSYRRQKAKLYQW